MFLAAFPHLGKKTKVLELGCGTGAVSLLLANRGAAQVLGVDINAHVVELLQRSIGTTTLEDRVEARALDLRNYKELPCDAMDLVAANPPYRIGGRKRQVGQAACHEVGTTLEDFFRAAAYALKTKGRFALVQLPERFTDAVKLGLTYNLELKRLQWVHSCYVDRPAWIFLAEFVKGGRPGLEVLPPLIMYNRDGSYSRQTLVLLQGKKRQKNMENEKGTLYLCATPIGNLEDMTPRAVRMLQEADLIAAEDTRHTRQLLTHFGIHGQLISYHEHNKEKQGPVLLEALENGKDIALVTDAGFPRISDQGN